MNSLNDVFQRVAYKRLALVDLPYGSNQHEINGSVALRDFFQSSEQLRGRIVWRYFRDSCEPLSGEEGAFRYDTEAIIAGEEADFNFYDARAKSAERTGRSEWRLYYSDEFLNYAKPGDALILVRPAENAGDVAPVIYGLVFEQGSDWLRAAHTLLGISTESNRLRLIDQRSLSESQLTLLNRQIIEELGLAVSTPITPSDEQIVLERLGGRFPSTREMSALAREYSEADPSDPDQALLQWLDREEALFRALERQVVSKRLSETFAKSDDVDVDDFLNYSLSVQNRRKSRMGYALENHIEELIKSHGISYTRQGVTEGTRKADFLFPGAEEYKDPGFPDDRLRMLAAKASCKDRWRQVLDEAERISTKHLCTVSAYISENQTDEMNGRDVVLVVPKALQSAYTEKQRANALTLADFIRDVKSLQDSY